MKKEIQSLLDKFKEKHKNNKIHKNIIVILSCLVALITLHSLMLPARTLDTTDEYKLYLKDKYINEVYSWKIDNLYQTSFDLKLYYVDTNGNLINGKNITLDIGENYNNDIFSFGISSIDENKREVKDILQEYEIENINEDDRNYIFDHAEIYLNDTWQILTNANIIWCNKATDEIEPIDKDYGWYGTIDSDIKYIIDDNIEYKLVYRLVEPEEELEEIDKNKPLDEVNEVNDIEEVDEIDNIEEVDEIDNNDKIIKDNVELIEDEKVEETDNNDIKPIEEVTEDNNGNNDKETTEEVTDNNNVNNKLLQEKSNILMKSPKFTTYSLSKNNSVSSLDGTSGIKFGLYDYNGGNDATGINANGLYGYFSFRDSTLTPSPNINPDVDADGFGEKRAKVKAKLVNGNPVFDCQGFCSDDIKNTNLGYLFGEKTNAKGEETIGVTSYSPKNTLLQIETIDGVDYYYYSSNSNAVDYDITNQEFIVRNYKERGYIMSTYTNEKDRYEFLPFNYKENASSSGDYDYESETDKTEINHWYGMTMEFEFYMPKDGKINDKDMIFEFSGDDDVWVFIDDVLVLDLGGTHGAVDGSINFHTGEVNSFLNWDVPEGEESTGPKYNTSIKEMYQNAGETFEYNSSGKTFVDYTKHTLKFFYLERGAAVANCKIRFNIPVLPAGSLSVQKQFEGIEKYADDYEFTIYDEDNNPVKNVIYTIDEVEYTTDLNGKFTLKNNEVAVFVSKSANDEKNYLITNNKYYVKESSSLNSEIYSCKLNNNSCSKSYTEEELTNNPNLKYQAIVTLNPESKYEAVFINKTKTYNLLITKEAINSDEEELFDFEVSFKDNDKLIDLNELEFILPNDTLIKDNGTITFKIKSTESITIKNIPINTDVTIQEVNHDGYHVSMKSIVNGKEVPLVESDIYTINEINDNKTIKVYNTPGVMLPETGGNGVGIYLVIGLSLIIISLKYRWFYFHNMKEGG